MNKMLETDIAIVGGGMVGLSAALALAESGFDVALVDAKPLESLSDDAFDGRASALSYASWRMFQALGLSPALEDKVQRIEQILVSDGKVPTDLRRGGPAPLFLRFDAAEIDESGAEPLGYMAENRHLRQALTKAVLAHPRITVRAPDRVEAIDRQARQASLTLGSGVTIRSALLIAADGRNSFLRGEAGIRAQGWRYDQTAIVATAEIERDHDGVAHEYFLPSGPFAMLPLTGRRYSLVWTERPRPAQALMALDEAGFAEEMQRRFGDFCGAVTPSGPRWSYPLGLKIAESYTSERLALVGDAAHAIHPIAGQGFNAGLRDVAALADVLAERKRTGLDIGDELALARYERVSVYGLGGSQPRS